MGCKKNLSLSQVLSVGSFIAHSISNLISLFTSIGEEGAGLCASHTFVLRMYVSVLFLSLLVSRAGCRM